MKASWAGVFPAVTTKFKRDLSLDIDGMRAHFAWQIESGVDGLIVCGSVGENSALSFDEKLAILRLALEVSSGRVPVLATVAENTTAEAIRAVEAGAKAGADGFMVLPAMRYVSDRRETLTYYRTVAKVCAKPIMVYNNPVAYGVDVTPEMFAELADVAELVAIKESSDNVRRITDLIDLTGTRYALFCGVDDLAMEAMLMGAVGWVAGLVNAFPGETVAIYRFIRDRRIDDALAIYRWFSQLLHLDVSRKLVQNIKLVEALAGVGSEFVRPPRLPLEGDERARIEKTFAIAMQNRSTLPRLAAALRPRALAT
ncbi:MAG: dihydrodipicolinate synthase family protein [Betaproteobacteria bacterium]|nr:MAG: dihydrodipicolinate synthase family protein [Betaproteobacteria bacterium]